MAFVQPTSQTTNETLMELVKADVSALIDANNAGPDINLIPIAGITADKLKTFTVTNYAFYLGNANNAGYASAVLLIGAPIGTTANVTNFNRFISTAQADLYVSPAGITPATPNLAANLIATGTAYPRTPLKAYQLNTSTTIATGPTITLDQIVWSGPTVRNTPPAVTGANNVIQEYLFTVYNSTGGPQDMYVVFSMQMLAPLTIGGAS